MKRKTLFGFLLGLLAFISVMQFIRLNNDHLECEQTVERKQDAKGNIVTETKHVCKEKFNF
jgi:hypothetical protein